VQQSTSRRVITGVEILPEEQGYHPALGIYTRNISLHDVWLQSSVDLNSRRASGL